MRTKIIIALIAAQLIAISLLGMNIYKNHNLASIFSISPIARENIIFNKDSELEHFFEPAPNDYEDVYVPPWLPYKPEFTINSDTLNDRYEYSIEKPESTFRIITLGDSWTFGQFIHTKDNFSEVLEDSLNNNLVCHRFEKFEVINLGVPSYDIRYAVERFKLRGQKYKPDLVLWFFIGNDFEEIQDFVRPRMDLYLQNLRDRGELKDENETKHINQFNDLIKWWDKAVQDQYTELGEEKVMQYQEEALRSIDSYYKNTLVIFTLPLQEKFNRIIEKFVESREDSYFFKDEVFQFGKKFQLPDSHPNKEGHAFIARNLFDYLTEKKIIPCD